MEAPLLFDANNPGFGQKWFPGLVNFVPAVAYHLCLALPVAFTQPLAHLLAKPCTCFGEFVNCHGQLDLAMRAAAAIVSALPPSNAFSRVYRFPSAVTPVRGIFHTLDYFQAQYMYKDFFLLLKSQ